MPDLREKYNLLKEKLKSLDTKKNIDSLIKELDQEIDSVLQKSNGVKARKKYEKIVNQMSEHRDYLNVVFDSINSGVYIIDPESKEILEINNYALELLKYKKEDIVGKKCHELICNSTKLNCLGQNIKSCIGEVEKELIDSKGNAIPVIKSVKEITLEGKTLILETFTDISELKINEEKIAQREEILQATLEATDDAILVVDRKGKVINSNRQFYELINVIPQKFNQLSTFSAIKSTFKKLKNPFEAITNTKKILNTNKKLLDVLFFKDDRVYERYSAPIYKHDEKAGRVWRLKDITPQAKVEGKLRELNEDLENKISERTVELKISESRLKEAQEIAHLGHWVLDLKTKKIKGSENAYQLLGLTIDVEERKLTDFLNLVHPDDVYMLKRTFLTSLKKKTPFNIIHRVKDRVGKLIYLRQKCKIFYSSEGRPVYALGIAQDVTENKLAADSIAERERQLEMALLGTGLGLWDWNLRDNTIKINTRFIELIGYKGLIKSDVIKLDFLISILHEDDYDRIISKFLKYSQSPNATFEEEFRLKKADGDFIWVHARAKVFEWHKSKPSRSIGTFLDITERRKADIKMQKSEEKFRKLTELSPSPICIQSLDKLLFVNPAWVNALGYSEKEALQRSFVELVHPDDRAIAKRYSRLRLFGNNAPRRYEIKMLTKDQEVKWFDISVTVITFEGQTTSLAVLNDISKIKKTEAALRESEEKFKALFHGNQSVMLLIDTETRGFIEANQTACDFYEYPADVIKTMHVGQISMLEPKEIRKSLKMAIDGKRNKFLAKHKLANGEIRDVETYMGKVKYGGKDILYAIVHDITDRIIAEEKIKKNQEELRKLNAQKDKFFSIISHDLKGPIGNFMNFAELLKDHKELLTSESAESIIDHSYNLANNTYKLLENLLIWSKSQLGGIKINKQMMPIAPLFNETIDLLKDGAANKGVKIVNEVGKTTLIFADKDTILTILRNLISNSIKFTPKGGTITCSARKCADPDKEGQVEICISDTGVGIPESKIKELFTLGKEFTTFGTENEKGSGLGLILCKELVALNDGKIWAESKEDKGSKFSFSLKCLPEY